jgi:tRNA A-37 threonylcarbamoyl transferase component Bud32/tetratricopeptide (TPR) repeat protein
MSARDPKSTEKPASSPEEITLDAHGYAETAPISDEHLSLSSAGGAPSRPRMAEGELVAGRYRIVRFVAQGGMGEVYEAEDCELGEHVALKTIREETRDEIAEERFKREIQLSRKVTHPNVCRIFDVGYHGEGEGRVVFLTMEWLGGETLLEQIRRDGPLSIKDAGKVVRQIVAALTAAHAAGVVHRDLKSGNVLLAARKEAGPRAVVTDFGLAHVLGTGEDGRSLSGSGGIVGTPGYMAPEQVEGGPLSPRTDVYALGVVMYEMLTGRLPFEGATPLSVAAKRLTMPAPSPRKVRPDLPARWDRAVLACMERNPLDRPGSARAVLDLLEEDGGGSTSLRFPKLHRRARMLQPLFALLLAALAVVIGVRSWRTRPRAFGDELLLRGVTLGNFEPVDPGQMAAYGVLVRNAVRTDLALGFPTIDTRATVQLPDGRTIVLGQARPRLGQEPFRVGGRYSIRGEGADRRIEVTLTVVDPRNNEQRAAVVEAGPLRKLGQVIVHAGERLRAIAGVEANHRRPLSQAGRSALDATMEAMRDNDLAHALELVEQALAAEPDSVELRYTLGRVLAGLEFDVSSAVAIERAFALGPSDDPFWAERVEALRLRGDATRSAQILEKLYAKYPQNVDLGLDLSRVYLQAQRGDDALRLLDRLELQALQPRERLRLAVERLVVAERLERRDVVTRDFGAARQQARALKLPGLELAVLRVACTALAEEGAPQLSDPFCGELKTLAEQVRQPAALTAGELGWVAARVVSDVEGPLLDVSRRALALAIQVGGRRRLADALSTFAITTRDSDSAEYDEDLFVEALAIARDAHDQAIAVAVLENLSYYAITDGRQADGIRFLREAVELARDAGSQAMISDGQCRLGVALAGGGDVRGARRMLDDSLRLRVRSGQDPTADDCGLLSAIVLDDEGKLLEARARYHELAALEAKKGNPTWAYLEDAADVDLALHDWKGLLASTNRLMVLTSKNRGRREVQSAMLMRGIALAELGRKAEARALPPFVREHADHISKLDRARADLLIAGLDRRLGAPGDELGPRIEAIVAVGVSAQHGRLELDARLERLAVMVRDHDPAASRTAKELAQRANEMGNLRVASAAQAVARGGP